MDEKRKEHIVILPGWVTKYILDREHSIAEFYEPLVPLLSGYDVRIIEFPGFGQTPEPPQPWGVDDFVEFLRAELDRIGIEKTHVFGHSFGGQVAAKFAFRYPDRVSKLVLYNAACLREQSPKLEALRKLKNIGGAIFRLVPPLRKVFYKLAVGSTDYTRLPPIMRETMGRIVREDLGGILPHLSQETLVLWGSADRITPLRQGLTIKRLIPRAKMIVHPGGHSFHRTDPSTFASHVKNFLANG